MRIRWGLLSLQIHRSQCLIIDIGMMVALHAHDNLRRAIELHNIFEMNHTVLNMLHLE